MQKKYAILVAGGTGSRMGGNIPKQYLSLGGKPILVRTIEKFLAVTDCQIVLPISKGATHLWDEIRDKYFPNEDRILMIFGGDTRFQSVKNALDSIDTESGLVAVHDAVRPFVSLQLIEDSFITANRLGNAVPCVDSKDSVRFVEGGMNMAVDRSAVKLVQTPQAFSLKILKEAYAAPYESFYTDDASVVEHGGYDINLIMGEYSNIKITTPEDIQVGELLLKP